MNSKKTKGSPMISAALLIIAAAILKFTDSPFSVLNQKEADVFYSEPEYVESNSSETSLLNNDSHETYYESNLFTPEIIEEDIIFTDVSSFGAENIKVLNNTNLKPDYWALLNEELNFTQSQKDEPSVLIIHTHASESYTPSEKYDYEPTDPSRTEDTKYNMVRVGEEIAAGLVSAGIGVYHERELFDYPSYNGSYNRALERINELLAQYPSIQFVLDIHRDALITSDGKEYSGTCTIGSEQSAQILLVVGTGEGGLSHANWKENLKLALQLERIMEVKHDGFLRNLNLRKERFNQHATIGSLIVEVGCTGNTLDEALVAARAFSDCAQEVILQAISEPQNQ